ncbi:beta-mannosidase [Aureibacter tunicatorum]|uniref:Beta-mannosidase B n=1 Tax=Aureibacter tunicatorum TaxID=866807 RepID=A0AAE3XMG1_9BACT|nr:glycoside hydrolase family 2 protein [Aureibacter tunicatorum]MDR6238620.1 beta-mannosidase [Aureibacter tunicatorum]BDD05449.1 beta-mannosidase [Aureibacter tunicatorum]
MKQSRIWNVIMLFLATTSLFSCAQEQSKVYVESSLHDGWQFKQASKNEWKEAIVPGVVHMDLMRHGDIEDPFYRSNEKKVQWIEEEDWEYKTSFDVSEDLMNKDRIEIEFEGLDTYADVVINGIKVLSANNMFVRWNKDVKQYLKLGENEMKITFRSPINEVMDQYESTGFEYPADNDAHEKKLSVFTRKAPYHYGWDWGIRLVTSGIYRPITLKAWDEAKLVDVWVRQNHKEDRVELQHTIEVESFEDGQVQFVINSQDNSFESIQKTFDLKKGLNTLDLSFDIIDPELWWPNGFGEPHLYPVHYQLMSDNKILDELDRRIGLRTFEVINEPDSIGESFYMKVNGHPVFMKGTNYIPQDNLLPRVDSSRYEHLMNTAVASNMNMIRLWGGGIYENDYFYELADEKGLLLWQDFMFACTMYPGDEAFLENVKNEAVDNIRRLRNHPSLALWCGNNEIQMGWENWGWQESRNYSVQDSVLLYDYYTKLFKELLPQMVEEHDPGRFYYPSSPISNWGELEDFKYGDNHYWGVWWGKKPFESFREYIPRFMSEFGFQSFPEMRTIKKFATEEDWNIDSDVMKTHQKSSIGNITIKEYMDMYYREPKDFPSFVYLSQILQAEGMRMAFEAQRGAKPFCMGTLYWQLNDCWPVASWSGMDYYGNWKAMQYFVRDAFTPVLTTMEEKNGQLEVKIISDELADRSADLKLELYDFKGNQISTHSQKVEIPSNSSEVYWHKDVSDFLKGQDKKSVVLVAEVISEGKVLTKNTHYFVPVKDLKLKKSSSDIQIEQVDGGYDVTISSETLIKNLYLEIEGKGFWSDNYFDVVPGQLSKIRLETDKQLKSEDISSFSVVDTF